MFEDEIKSKSKKISMYSSHGGPFGQHIGNVWPKKALFSWYFHEKPYNDVNVGRYFGHYNPKLQQWWVTQSFFYIKRVKRNQNIAIWVGFGVMVPIFVQPLAKLGVLIFGKYWIIWHFMTICHTLMYTYGSQKYTQTL